MSLTTIFEFLKEIKVRHSQAEVAAERECKGPTEFELCFQVFDLKEKKIIKKTFFPSILISVNISGKFLSSKVIS